MPVPSGEIRIFISTFPISPVVSGGIAINGIGQLAWFPTYPLWSLVALGLEVAVRWALTVGWKDAQAELRGF